MGGDGDKGGGGARGGDKGGGGDGGGGVHELAVQIYCALYEHPVSQQTLTSFASHMRMP